MLNDEVTGVTERAIPGVCRAKKAAGRSALGAEHPVADEQSVQEIFETSWGGEEAMGQAVCPVAASGT